MKALKLVIGCIILFATGCKERNTQSGKQGITPEFLRCEYLVEPEGIDTKNPRLSWYSESEQREQVQTAYQVLVASSLSNLEAGTADLWNTGKVLSDSSAYIPYHGKELSSGMQAFWKVKLWDKDGKESEWSKPGYWSMGLLEKSDWKGKWIGLDKAVGNDNPDTEHRRLSARYLRKDFSLKGEVKRATAYICGLGWHELYLNGQKIGDHVMSPGFTDYAKRSFYVTHDVTAQLKKGNNAVGTILGNGKYFAPRLTDPAKFILDYGFPKLLLQINIEYADGSKDQVVSDVDWKVTANGPITENNEYDGEAYDARKEMPGWNMPGYDDSKWRKAELVTNLSEHLSAQMIDPLRITKTLKPVGMTNPSPGVYVFDMGQNMVGWTRLKMKGKKGTVVKQKFAELIFPDGNIDVSTMRGAKVTDKYILKGDGTEVYEPRFTYHGFRYVEVTGYPGTPDLSVIEGMVHHDDLEVVGQFECSNTMINSIYRNATWSISGNNRSIPTDCPQRDERLGWLGDRSGECVGESYIFDESKFYRKWTQDMFDGQHDDGRLHLIAPALLDFNAEDVTWPGTALYTVHMLYGQYGDLHYVEESYDNLKKWIDYMVSTAMTNGLVLRDGLGDWCAPPLYRSSGEVVHIKHNGGMIGSSSFHHMLGMMAEYAKLLGKEQDAEYYQGLVTKGKKAFNDLFLDTVSGKYIESSMTTNVLALAYDLVPEEYKKSVIDDLVLQIELTHDGNLGVGLIGMQNLMRVLTLNGRADIAYRFATQTTYPSWGYMVKNGATTIWERWNGDKTRGGMNSYNHVMMLGDFVEWLYGDLGGIRAGSPGFKTLEMNPVIVEDLSYVKASHKTMYGIVESNWEINNNTFHWNISIPVNVTATICVPAANEKDVMENGKKASKSQGVEFIRMSKKGAIFKVSSGKYSFTSRGYEGFIVKNSSLAVTRISPIGGDLKSSETISMKSDTDGATIRYTLDGSGPTEKSKKYTAPFTLEKSCAVKFRSFKDGMEPGYVSQADYSVYDEKNNGVNYKYYEGSWRRLPDFNTLKPKSEGTATNFNYRGINKREHNFGIHFQTWIEILKDGKYTFFLACDDGGKLYIDNKILVDNDGLHGNKELFGEVNLKKGKYSIVVEYMQGGRGKALKVSWKEPGGLKKRLGASNLFLAKE